MFPVELSPKFFRYFIVSRGTYNARILTIVDNFRDLGIISGVFCGQSVLIVEKIP